MESHQAQVPRGTELLPEKVSVRQVKSHVRPGEEDSDGKVPSSRDGSPVGQALHGTTVSWEKNGKFLPGL